MGSECGEKLKHVVRARNKSLRARVMIPFSERPISGEATLVCLQVLEYPCLYIASEDSVASVSVL